MDAIQKRKNVISIVSIGAMITVCTMALIAMQTGVFAADNSIFSNITSATTQIIDQLLKVAVYVAAFSVVWCAIKLIVFSDQQTAGRAKTHLIRAIAFLFVALSVKPIINFVKSMSNNSSASFTSL